MSTQRSDEARAYRWLYDTREWLELREYQLRKDPLCRYCLRQGLVTAATVVNHRTPHKGDAQLFFDPANLESVCKLHHDGPIQSHERTGHERGCDANGIPHDPPTHWRDDGGRG